MRRKRFIVLVASIVLLVALSLVPGATVLVAVPSEPRQGRIEFDGMALETRRVELKRTFPGGSAAARQAHGEVIFSFSGDNIFQTIDFERARVPRGTTVGTCPAGDTDGCPVGVVLFRTTAEATFDRDRQDCLLTCRAFSKSVPITAAAAGAEGNVEERTISHVGLTHVEGRRLFVTNPDPIVGGTAEGSMSADSLRALEREVEAEVRVDVRRRSLVVARRRGFDAVAIGLRAKTTNDAIADTSSGPFEVRVVARPVVVAYSRDVMLAEAEERLGAGPRALGRDLIPSTVRAEPVEPDPTGYLPGRSGPVQITPKPDTVYQLSAEAHARSTNVDLRGLRSSVARRTDEGTRDALADQDAELVSLNRSPSWWPIVLWARRVNVEAQPVAQ